MLDSVVLDIDVACHTPLVPMSISILISQPSMGSHCDLSKGECRQGQGKEKKEIDGS
jgi:hypothetical protein